MCCAVVKRGMPCLPNSHAIEVPSIRWSGPPLRVTGGPSVLTKL